MNNHKFSRINRRQFLCGASASAALFQILPGTVLHGAERIAANTYIHPAYRKGWSL
jgi:hypothetical protein